jgi:response regulator of citrate/malate metabolism
LRRQPRYLLTFREAAEHIGLTEVTLRRYWDRHLIGYVVFRWKYGIIGRARRYIPRACISEFLERRAARRHG